MFWGQPIYGMSTVSSLEFPSQLTPGGLVTFVVAPLSMNVSNLIFNLFTSKTNLMDNLSHTRTSCFILKSLVIVLPQ